MGGLFLNLEIGGPGVKMKSAFVFLTVEAGGFGGIALRGAGAVPIAHGDVALGGQRMARQIELMEIEFHLGVRPIENRIGLEGFLLLLDERPVGAGRRLRAAQSAEPDIGAGFAQRAVERFDLGEHGIAVGFGSSTLPQVAPQRLHAGGRHRGLIDPQIQREAGAEFLGIAIGFRKQKPGVDEDHRDFRRVGVNEVQHHRGLDAETGGGHQAVAQPLVEQADSLARAQWRERGGQFVGQGLGWGWGSHGIWRRNQTFRALAEASGLTL